MEYFRLSNNVLMPSEGFGVFQIADQNQCKIVVLEAINTGYRLFDTASIYGNEEAVGIAIKESGVTREELFITTKAWVHEMGFERTKQAFEDSLARLQTKYIDLYLIHMPYGDYYGSWRAIEELYKDGRIRAIGVCNFEPDRLLDLCNNCEIRPMVNQIEMHPFSQKSSAIVQMNELGVQPQAWAPFAEGKNKIFSNPILMQIAEKHNKSIAQITLRWNIQRGVVVIPKSVKVERMKENLAIHDFSLDTQDMQQIATLDSGQSLILDVRSTNEVERIFNIK